MIGAQDTIEDRPWLTLFPAGMVVLTVLAVSLVGDALRDALDPRRGRRAPSAPERPAAEPALVALGSAVGLVGRHGPGVGLGQAQEGGGVRRDGDLCRDRGQEGVAGLCRTGGGLGAQLSGVGCGTLSIGGARSV